MTGLITYTHGLGRRFARAARPEAPVRRVYFSFHRGDDLTPAEDIRDAWRSGHEAERQAYGFHDGPLWDDACRRGDDAVKSLIRHALTATEVTCVLAGARTQLDRWVRYEIARSVANGNGLLCVEFDAADAEGRVAEDGEDPLDHLGLHRAPSGRCLLAERKDGNWVRYEDFSPGFDLPGGWRLPDTPAITPLSEYARSYCYERDGGAADLARWIDAAAGVSRIRGSVRRRPV